MNKGIMIRINAGAATVILLLTVIGLSVFAVLSLRAAHSEKEIAEGSAAAVTAYYEADARAEEILFELEQKLCEGEDFEAAAAAIPELKDITEDNEVVILIDAGSSSYMVLKLKEASGSVRVIERRLSAEDMDGYAEAGFAVIDSLPYELIGD